MIALVADASRDVLEAPLCDEAEPPCGVALALQLVALAVSHLLTLALAKLAQRLNINAVSVPSSVRPLYLTIFAGRHFSGTS